MEFLGVISTIMDLTQKESEFSDELNTINMTCMSLQMAVSEQKMSNHINNPSNSLKFCFFHPRLPPHLRDMIRTHLKETQELIKKTTGAKNWWKNIKYLLPGSDLHKLKEKNGQLLHAINLVNLHVNSVKGASLRKLKTQTGSGYLEEDEEPDTAQKLKTDRSILAISATIEDPAEESKAISATIQDTQLDGNDDEEEELREPAFRLVFIHDKKTYEQCIPSAQKVLNVERYWENDASGYLIEREALMYLPELVCGRLSKSHAELRAQRVESKLERLSKEDLAMNPTLDDCLLNNRNGDENAVSFELLDTSTNGTFILKNHSYGRISGPVATISGDFKNIKKGNKIALQHLDIVGLVMSKPSLKEVLFGFQFICEGL